jgi:hypothetical protein
MIFVIIARIVMQLLRNKREKAKKVDFSGSLVSSPPPPPRARANASIVPFASQLQMS